MSAAFDAASGGYHAILIGIDAYKAKPLRGGVHDVQSIQSYLERASIPIQIKTFLAPNNVKTLPSDTTTRATSWPSYSNVTEAFGNVILNAKTGDYVYIHFSGHGSRSEPVDEYSNKSTGDLALVLLEGENKTTERYLYGSRLALSLKAMINKGLKVSLVLDCCFSASFYRADPTTRFLPFKPEISQNFHSDQPQRQSAKRSPTDHADRDASMFPSWLLDPMEYTVLSACGPHELASEFASKDGSIHGAFSYFLLSALNEYGLGRSHQDIHNRLCGIFKMSWQDQNPVLYGNKARGFLGSLRPGTKEAAITAIRFGQSLELQAGEAHGIQKGDDFALAPSLSAGITQSPRPDAILVSVDSVGPLTSHLQHKPEAIGTQQIWEAKPLVRHALGNFKIGLAASIPFREKMVQALEKRLPGADISTNSEACWFLVAVQESRFAIINQKNETLENLPIITQEPASIHRLADTLEHLMRFDLVMTLTNNTIQNSFPNSFSASLVSASQECFGPESSITVEHNRTVTNLRITNESTENLYIHAYNLGPSWSIRNMLAASYETLPPRNELRGFSGTFEKKIRMTIPASMRRNGACQCKDTIKVFVTSQVTSFDFLELPGLCDNEILRSTRGPSICSDTLAETVPSSVSWAGINFYIHTVLEA